MNDIEISQAATEAPITEIAGKLDLSADQIEQYGAVKAKIKLPVTGDASTSKLILVTSINPTPAGEGKSTVTVGLGDALQRQGKKVAIALREPSLGPVMGIKVVPRVAGMRRLFQWKISTCTLLGTWAH